MNLLASNDLSQNFINQSYTDLNQLQSLKKADDDVALREISKQFESFFVQMIMKSMRSANSVFSEGSFLQSNEMKFHQDMYDNQLSLTLSNGKGSGLADILYKQMSKSYLNKDKEPTIEPGKLERSTLSSKSNYQTISFEDIKNTVVSVANTAFDAIKTPIDFVNAIRPYAEKIAKLIGVDDKVIIAQAALETGWGKHVIKDSQGRSSLNLFNIKVGSSWQGKSVGVSTLEYYNGVAQKETARFRRYDSLEDSFMDFYQLLQNSRYSSVLKNSDNPENFVRELQRSGYATDPNYAEKILSIMNSDALKE